MMKANPEDDHHPHHHLQSAPLLSDLRRKVVLDMEWRHSIIPVVRIDGKLTSFQRILSFGAVVAPNLTKDNLGSAAVNKFIAHVQNLLRADAFDDSVMTQLIDSAAIKLLALYFDRDSADLSY